MTVKRDLAEYATAINSNEMEGHSHISTRGPQ